MHRALTPAGSCISPEPLPPQAGRRSARRDASKAPVRHRRPAV